MSNHIYFENEVNNTEKQTFLQPLGGEGKQTLSYLGKTKWLCKRLAKTKFEPQFTKYPTNSMDTDKATEIHNIFAEVNMPKSLFTQMVS